ncbi:LLM class flavin-dependent oxidoreductase [Antrihabitans stalactiti]|uniref:LLM class flavin-dependent oxidoreductase n=1 Tax=Antrihabitans stalactiti TaxID=2584121 RepID=A0A848K821_9NOCA|nr:LLM class flavin-dependent oxidoreductase [Antrihabitans stalactiti]NMN93444.1 LLM class flavin-dependent oxidoreductase [Antrihabitans stalactiti]
MTDFMPLAVGVTPLETRRDVIVHVATRAEELGYSSFSAAEGWGHDVTVLLAEVALKTSRIRIGTGVLNVWGRSAGTIAMAATSLAELSNGRFSLGLGAGSPSLAEGLHDKAFRDPIAQLGAITRQVRGLLAGERMTPSEPFETRPLKLAVRPAAPVPINIAGLGPRSIRLTGELADAWYPFLMPRSGLTDGVLLLKEGAGRVPGGRSLPTISPGIPVGISPDPAVARTVAAWWVSFYLTSMGPLYAGELRKRGFGAAVDDVLAANPGRGTAEVPASAQVLIDELTLCGDAETARAGLDSWYAAGADEPTLVLPPNRPVEELDYILEGMRPTAR